MIEHIKERIIPYRDMLLLAVQHVMHEDRPEAAVVYGGFLRDVVVGGIPADIDVAAGRPQNVGILPPPDYGNMPVLIRQYTSDDCDVPHEVNHVLLDLPGDDLLRGAATRCDIGICQISYDPATDEVYFTEQFMQDLRDKVLRTDVDLCGSRESAAYARLEMLSTRPQFMGWRCEF